MPGKAAIFSIELINLKPYFYTLNVWRQYLKVLARPCLRTPRIMAWQNSITMRVSQMASGAISAE